MMEKEKDAWIDDVLNSLQGSQRAQARDDLFEQIEAKLSRPKAKIIPMKQLRMVAAASVILLLLNGFAIRQYTLGNTANDTEASVEIASDQLLISNYNFYE
jgi:hypothetical protein